MDSGGATGIPTWNLTVIKCVTWIYIQCVGRRECENQSLHALSLLATHPGRFIVITSREKERKGAGKSQKGKAMIWIMK